MRRMSIGIILFLGLFGLIGALITGYGMIAVMRSRAASKWPTTEGRIEACDFKEHTDSENGSTYSVEVKYSYVVDDLRYEGSRIAFGYLGSNGRDLHQEIYDKLNGAATVSVRYNPQDPKEATLAYGLNRLTLGLIVFGVVFMAMPTGVATILWLTERGILTYPHWAGIAETIMVR